MVLNNSGGHPHHTNSTTTSSSGHLHSHRSMLRFSRSSRLFIAMASVFISFMVVVHFGFLQAVHQEIFKQTLSALTPSNVSLVTKTSLATFLTPTKAPTQPSMLNSGTQVLRGSSPHTPTPSLASRPHHKDSETGLIMDQLTFVLFTRLADREGFPRIWTLLLSVLKFSAPELLHTFAVVVPDSDYETLVSAVKGFQRYCIQCRFTFLPIKDSMLLSSTDMSVYAQFTPVAEKSGGGRGVNYRIQMLLKLAVAQLIPTQFYVTLDSDVCMVRPTNFTDLVVNGKAIYQGEMLGHTRHNPNWWIAADSLLHASGCYQTLPNFIGVTPAILSTEISVQFLKAVAKEHRNQTMEILAWDVTLFKSLHQFDWTEYTLYWTYACREKLITKYHILSPKGLRLYDYHGFEFGSYHSWKPELVFNQQQPSVQYFARQPYANPTHGGPAYLGQSFVFSVLQSISGADPSWVNNQILPYLN